MAEKLNLNEPSNKPQPNPEKAPANPRDAVRAKRAARLRVIDGPPKTIKVYAANEFVRQSLRHAVGTPFPESPDEAVEWPNDSFTTRRINDGSVTLEPGTGAEYGPPDESLNAREQAAAMKPKKEENGNGKPEGKSTGKYTPPNAA